VQLVDHALCLHKRAADERYYDGRRPQPNGEF
jgi:hypothetical protein